MSGVSVIILILGLMSLGKSTKESIEAIPNLRFVREPSNSYVGRGHSLKLHCKAICNCTFPIHYSWTKNGENISDNYAFEKGSGDLFIASFSQSRDEGTYVCFAEAAGIVIRSLEGSVTTAHLSKVELKTPQKQILLGSIAILHCASDNVPKKRGLSFRWYKDGQLLTPGPKVNMLSSGELIIKNVSLSTQGKYKCSVTNAFSKDTVESNRLPILVEEHGKSRYPTFLMKPLNKTVVMNHRTFIICIASGTPLPTVTLYMESKILPGSLVKITAGKGGVVYNIALVAQDNAGVYQCVASWDGKHIMEKAWLTVLVPPSFPFQLTDRLIRPEGGEATLRCSAYGNPPPKVEWYFRGEKIAHKNCRICSDNNGKLRLEDNKLFDSGIYQCFAKNTAGQAKFAKLFYVRNEGGPLQAPQNVTAVATSPTTIGVHWDHPNVEGAGTLVAYTVLWKENGTREGRARVVDAEKSSFTIDGLFGGTVYEVYVQSYALKRTGMASEKLYIKTPEGVPLISPSNVKIRNEGNGRLVVDWTAIDRQFSNGVLIKYTVFYGKVGSQQTKKMQSVPGNTLTADIIGLQEGDLYTIEVAGMTSTGYGPRSKMIPIKVADPNETDLDKLTLRWKWINKTTVNVTWDLPISSIQVTGFRMLYINASFTNYFNEVRILKFPASVHHYAINGLRRKMLYRLELSVLYNGMQGRSAVVVLDGVLHNIPRALEPSMGNLSEPKDVECDTKDSRSIFLSWGKPTVSRSLHGYTASISSNVNTFVKTFQTKDHKHLFSNLEPGTWYYLKVSSNKVEGTRVVRISSKYIACKTFETKPERPQNISWKLSYKGSKIILRYHPPLKPNGLVIRYIVRYRILGPESQWTDKIVNLATVNPELRYPSVRTSLNLPRHFSYEVEVAAENSAGRGEFIKLIIPKAKEIPPPIPKPPAATTKPPQYSETTVGIIVGCSIAAVFVMLLIVVIIWKNPCRVETNQKRLTNSQNSNSAYLYMQTMQDGKMGNGAGNGSLRNGNYGRTYLPPSDRREANGYIPKDRTTENGETIPRPEMTRHPNTTDVTGSSSGPPLCTCVCFQHGRNIHQGASNDRVSQVSRATSTRDHELPVDSGSTASEERESAESADSRTQMLPSRHRERRSDFHGHKTTTRDYIHKVQETTFHV